MTALDPIARLLPLVGAWRGVSRVWFEPSKHEGDNPVEGTFALLHSERFGEFTYRSSFQGKPLEGRLTMGHYPGRKRWEVVLIDSFHMGRGQLFCVGQSTATGFDVLGHYPDGADGPDWGWRTELTVQSPDAITLTAYNVEPSGAEAIATQMVLERVK